MTDIYAEFGTLANIDTSIPECKRKARIRDFFQSKYYVRSYMMVHFIMDEIGSEGV